jgi:hypothetical protein
VATNIDGGSAGLGAAAFIVAGLIDAQFAWSAVAIFHAAIDTGNAGLVLADLATAAVLLACAAVRAPTILANAALAAVGIQLTALFLATIPGAGATNGINTDFLLAAHPAGARCLYRSGDATAAAVANKTLAKSPTATAAGAKPAAFAGAIAAIGSGATARIGGAGQILGNAAVVGTKKSLTTIGIRLTFCF